MKFEHKSPIALAEAVKKTEKIFSGLSADIITKYSAENNYRKLKEIYETCCDYN